ncbi:hypothetical protein [Hymenobacter yonginensis]|uniref:Uncharacterized protein n=1 Tax=Hymenobacter yonginensis TaxID=748197 RepID=A0ABY7PT87_9BACT|nr:hypothetical protein [Hymenobacter yonginensis]WBO86153.1 hypothetical protein O9Z63_07815 [Hymenobacter yonginensis]
MKRVLGYVLIGLAVVLALAAVGQVQALLQAIGGVLFIFSGRLDAAGAGRAMGHLFYWFLHFGLLYWLWHHGRQWTKAPVGKTE